MRSLFTLCLMLTTVTVAQAQTPSAVPATTQPAMEQPAVAPSVTPTDTVATIPGQLSNAAGSALDSLASKAKQIKDATLPNALPAGLALPEALGGGPGAVAPEDVSPNFKQGQDKSVTVTSEGKPQSLFFTPNQLASIMRGKQGYLAPRDAFDPGNQGANPNAPVPQVISLSGIVYIDKNDWVIWLNGERVTRKNMPQRLVGLSVKPDRVHIRWMDVSHQRIINITLEPHQQYLLDSDTIIPIG